MRREQLGLRALLALMALVVLAAACSGGDSDDTSDTSDDTEAAATEDAADDAAPDEEPADDAADDEAEDEATADDEAADDEAADAGPAEEITYVLAASVLAPKEEVATYAVPQQLGYFEEENVSVTIENADGSTAALQAVASGSADITAADLGSIYAAADSGVPIVALGGLVVNWPWRIGVPAGSDIASCEDLQGTRIGIISLASGSNPFARSFVESCGLDPDADVQLLPVGVGPQAAAALDGGEVDSLALYTQAYTSLEQAGTELTYLDNPPDFDPLVSLTWAVSRDTLEQRPDAIAGFLRAAYRGLTYSVVNTEHAMELGYEVIPQILGDATAEERLEGDTQLLATWLETAALEGDPASWSDFGYLDEEQLTATMDYAISAGTVEEAFDPSEVYDDRLLDVANDWDVAEVVEAASSAG